LCEIPAPLEDDDGAALGSALGDLTALRLQRPDDDSIFSSIIVMSMLHEASADVTA
jgi:hypothetical protein